MEHYTEHGTVCQIYNRTFHLHQQSFISTPSLAVIYAQLMNGYGLKCSVINLTFNITFH